MRSSPAPSGSSSPIRLPSLHTLTRVAPALFLADVLFFCCVNTGDDSSVITVFWWIVFICLGISAVLTTNAIWHRGLVVYFVALYLKLFSVAFHFVSMAVSQAYSVSTAIFVYGLVTLFILAECFTLGMLLWLIDEEQTEEERAPVEDIEGGGMLVSKFQTANTWTLEIVSFLLLAVPGYGPIMALARRKKHT